ncbi:MAG: hypothetical protein J6W69_08690 [Bacteroidales bacterium]|nr:hypothetical protein [Bacteroidales bacterium]
METIKIFLAGAKNLQDERLRLKALANAQSFRYGREGHQVAINMSSYEDFGDKQAIYDDFIRNEADVVIFLFDQRIGEKTEAEIRLAYDTQRRHGRPEVFSFVRAFEQRTPEIDYLEKVLNAVTDNYYIDYANADDLLNKAKERISAYVDCRLAETAMLHSSAGAAPLATTQTPLFHVFLGVCTGYYVACGVAWMLFYSLLGQSLGLTLRAYVAGILVLTVVWIVIASIVGRHDRGYNAQQTALVASTDDVRTYVAELKIMAGQYSRPDTERLWKRLIQDAESIPPRQFMAQKAALHARAMKLKVGS